MTDFALARRNMVDGQLRPNRVTNSQLLAVIGALPREQFLPDGVRSVAYSDDDVPLGNGRFLMEPMVLARLIQTLQPRETDRALVVASGPGYGAALLARLVKSVVAVESDAGPGRPRPSRRPRSWASPASSRRSGRWRQGAAASGPYDVILIEGAVQTGTPGNPRAACGRRAAGDRSSPARPARWACAQLFVKEGGVASGRPLFDAGTPPSAGLRAAAALHLLIAAVRSVVGLGTMRF